ncbi:hypothetical protein NL676_030883 [Syzygium grande]|nr:hypothetical protein NL676_030883 [Syzygium grande]
MIGGHFAFAAAAGPGGVQLHHASAKLPKYPSLQPFITTPDLLPARPAQMSTLSSTPGSVEPDPSPQLGYSMDHWPTVRSAESGFK